MLMETVHDKKKSVVLGHRSTTIPLLSIQMSHPEIKHGKMNKLHPASDDYTKRYKSEEHW